MLTRALIAIGLLLAAAAPTAMAQLSMTGFGPASGGGAVVLTNLRITGIGDFRIINTTDNRAVFP